MACCSWETRETLVATKIRRTVMMMDSGACGNISNFSQLAGMRGLMGCSTDVSWNCRSFQTSAKVCSVWKCSSHSRCPYDRYGLKTADSGYLTRRLVTLRKTLSFVRRLWNRPWLAQLLRLTKKKWSSHWKNVCRTYLTQRVKHPRNWWSYHRPNEIITEDNAREDCQCWSWRNDNPFCLYMWTLNMVYVTVTDQLSDRFRSWSWWSSRNQSLLNLSGNLVHSLQCVRSIRVGLPLIPISLKVFLVSKEIFEARNPKGDAVNHWSQEEVVSIEENAWKSY